MIAEHRLALPAGYQLGKYRFRGILGAGGFGITYLADDPTLGRRVAIKELLPNDIATRLDGTTVVAKTKSEESNLAWARERFLEEGKALAACEHPNVVHVYEMIEANGTAYMVTKYEGGRSMADWLENLGRPANEAELRGLLAPLLSGLEKVHRAGFLHRDIKPENIYITDDGRPLLLDFGSARQAVTDRSAMLTSIVTTGYAPYEQYYEDGKQGPWSDIYALAGVMYRSIQGEKPPEATRRLKNDACVKLAKKFSNQYQTQFLTAIDKALAVEYQDRPQTVVAWRSMLGTGASADPDELGNSPREKWLHRMRHAVELLLDHPRIGASAAGFVVLVCGWAAWKGAQPKPIPPVAPVTPVPVVVVTTPSPTTSKVEVTPPPTSVAVVKPPPAPTPAPLAPNPNPVATPAVSENAGPIVDQQLLGMWTTKITTPNGFVALKWEQLDDGRYTLSGGVMDNGTLTAQGGTMHQVSNVTHLKATTTYEFKGANQLVTAIIGDPNGPVTWKRVGTATKSTTSRSRNNNDAPSHRSTTDWHNIPIPRNLPFRPF